MRPSSRSYLNFSFIKADNNISSMTSATSVSRPTLPQSRPEPAPASATCNLDLIDKNLFQADVETMIAASNSLESLSLHYGTLIGATNMASFLAAMGSSPSSLKKLSLRNISLSHVEPGTLGSAVRGLTSLSDLTPA